MSLKDELTAEVTRIFRSRWTERDGDVVPDDEDVALRNDAVKLKATVLYADLADSTDLVDDYLPFFAAEIYKAFLYCAAQIIRSESGEITAYDGDRVMAVFIGETKNTQAVRAALKINSAAIIINEQKRIQYPDNKYTLRHVVGVDTSTLFIAKTGVRGANDLVWVGRAANYAAKLSALPAAYNTYITKEVYDRMLEVVRSTNAVNMWEAVRWDALDGRTIYRSACSWADIP
jgi:class 3 adenylate cyclase